MLKCLTQLYNVFHCPFTLAFARQPVKIVALHIALCCLATLDLQRDSPTWRDKGSVAGEAHLRRPHSRLARIQEVLWTNGPSAQPHEALYQQLFLAQNCSMNDDVYRGRDQDRWRCWDYNRTVVWRSRTAATP